MRGTSGELRHKYHLLMNKEPIGAPPTEELRAKTKDELISTVFALHNVIKIQYNARLRDIAAAEQVERKLTLLNRRNRISDLQTFMKRLKKIPLSNEEKLALIEQEINQTAAKYTKRG